MTILGSTAALFLKKASALATLRKIMSNWNLYIGGTFYLFAAVLNIYILRYLDYSIVLSLNSLTYVWTMILSFFILKEKITVQKASGAIGIVIGAVLITIQGS